VNEPEPLAVKGAVEAERWGLRHEAFVLVLGAILAVQAGGGTRAAGPAPATFARDIAPILNAHCVSCHRPNQIGPMSLTSYGEARPWARAIKAKVVARQMPPWGADPRYGRFKNDWSLSQAQVDVIAAWVDAGAPMGDAKDLAPAPIFADDTWDGGAPDTVIEIPEQHLPAEGELDPPSFIVANPFKRDVWIQGSQVLPGNRRIVHHASPHVVKLPAGAVIKEDQKAYWPDGRPLKRSEFPVYAAIGETILDQDAAKLGAYLPGRGVEWYPEGTARRFPKDAYIELNVHYQLSGKPETDRTRLGLYLAKGPVRREIRNGGGVDPAGFREVAGRQTPAGGIPNIPPFADNFQVSGSTLFSRPATLYALSPHMHLRGKDMMFILIQPDGREEILLSVPKFDFNWQLIYEFETPVALAPGSRLRAIAHYDNSTRNRSNPAPHQEVRWSQQSSDEMFSPEIRFTYDDIDLTKTSEQ
jgi:mono/diheme cytochrome c family protein